MKLIKMNPVFIAVVGFVVVSCSNADIESRVARLEGRVTELEGVGKIVGSKPFDVIQPVVSATKLVEPLPELSFATESHDFGVINEGDVVEYTFAFENTGNAPLIISTASGSCGCTVPEWPKEPIGAGEKGEIKVSFNSSKKPGIQNKTVTITSNAFPNQKAIKIKAIVTSASKDAEVNK